MERALLRLRDLRPKLLGGKLTAPDRVGTPEIKNVFPKAMFSEW